MSRSQMTRWILGFLLASPFLWRGVERLRPRTRPVDPAAALAGKELFLHEWTSKDPLAVANGGDGVVPVFNARSCAECHRQGGTGGSGSSENNVNIFTVRPVGPRAHAEKERQGVVHTQAVRPEFRESFAHFSLGLPVDLPSKSMTLAALRELDLPDGVNFSQRKTPALFGGSLIDQIPEREIIANERIQRMKWGLASSTSKELPIGRVLRMTDGRIGRFGWKAQTASLAEFVRAACANELGLGNPGQAQPQPLGKPYRTVGYDLTLAQCDQLTEFISSLPRPVERKPDEAAAGRAAAVGKSLFASVGCADCHVPNVGSVSGLYSDLLLHDMGQELEAGGNYNDRALEDPSFKSGTGPLPAEWRTPPLWGVARSAPYLHDGRAITLEQAIAQHGGQGKKSTDRFAKLSATEQAQLISFLKTLDTP